MTLHFKSTRTSVSVLRFLHNLPNFARLYWRLIQDRRVSVWPKGLLLLSILYAFSPLDLLPDVVPLIGQIDDLQRSPVYGLRGRLNPMRTLAIAPAPQFSPNLVAAQGRARIFVSRLFIYLCPREVIREHVRVISVAS